MAVGKPILLIIILIQFCYIYAFENETQRKSSSSSNQNMFDVFEMELIEKYQKECNNSEAKTPAGHCPLYFDQLLCWPQTGAGQTVVKNCPPFKGFYSYEKASKRCNASGSWDSADYSPCYVNAKSKLNFQVRNVIAHLGYGFSAVLLTASVTIMLYFPRLRCPRNTIHIHLFFSFLMRIIGFVFSRVSSDKVITLCRITTILSYFGIVSSYTWIFVEALFLHNVIIVHTMSEPQKYMHIYTAIGWTMPSVMCVICFIIKYLWQSPNNPCWVSILPPERWLYIYTATLVLANFGIFVNVMRVLYLKMQVQPTSAANRKLLKSTFILVVVFGIYYIVTAPIDIVAATITIKKGTIIETLQLYFEQILESFQGSFVAILFCFVNSEVLAEIKRKFHNYRGNSTQRSQVVSLLPNESGKSHNIHKSKINGHREETIALKLTEDNHRNSSQIEANSSENVE